MGEEAVFSRRSNFFTASDPLLNSRHSRLKAFAPCLCAWRRRELQAVLLPKLDHARNVLLLFRTQRADLLKESFEARRRDDAHKATGRLAKVAVSVRYPARRENRRAFLGDERFPANRPL